MCGFVCACLSICVCVCECVCGSVCLCVSYLHLAVSMWASVWWGWQAGRHLYGATYLPSTSCTADPDEDHENLVFSMHVHVSVQCGAYQSRGRDSSFIVFHVWSPASHLEPCWWTHVWGSSNEWNQSAQCVWVEHTKKEKKPERTIFRSLTCSCSSVWCLVLVCWLCML